MKICAVYKQPIDAEGKVLEGSKAQLIAYFPRNKDELIEAITANFTIGVGNLTEIQEGKAWQADMVKINEEKWKLTFIFHEIGERFIFAQNLKDYKAAMNKEAQVIIDSPIDYDAINWIDNPYF